MVSICSDEGMPSDRAVRYWIESKPDVASVIAHARESGFDVIANDCLNIADTPVQGEELKYNEAGELIERKVGDMLGHRKVQIETRLKLLAKWDPKRYGDKVDLNHGIQPGDPLAALLQQISGSSLKPVSDDGADE